jgi:hypothetical protein
MLHPIAYKDCKTETDYACYKQHVAELDAARAAALALQNAIIASGQLRLLDRVHGLIDEICAERDEYTKDEADEIQHTFRAGVIDNDQ